MVTFLLGRIGFDCTREMFENDGKAQEFKERKLYDIEEGRKRQDDFGYSPPNGIMQAPTLVVITEGVSEVYTNASAVKGFSEKVC